MRDSAQVDLMACFEICPHDCGRTIEMVHQRHCNDMVNVLKSFSNPATANVQVLAARLPTALDVLMTTELWSRFRQGSAGTRQDLATAMAEEDPDCLGCASLLLFYRAAPYVAVCVLAKPFRGDDYRETLASLGLATRTAINIGMHARELVSQV